jgi:regulator of sigma E protease
MNIIYFIGSIAFLILIHETGHFLAAKAFGIKVEEFGIGFPPKLFKMFSYKGTDYTFNLLPLGGFVRPAGENDPDFPGGLAAASPWKRMAVMFAGPLMNLLVGILIYSIMFYQIGSPVFDKVIVFGVSPGSPAETAGLLEGDLFITIDGEEIDSTDKLHETIYANLGQEINVLVEREGEQVALSIIPRDPPPPEGAIGIQMGNDSEHLGLFTSIFYGSKATFQHIGMIFSLPYKLMTGELTGEEGRLLGYKGMYDLYEDFRERDETAVVEVTGGINTLGFYAAITLSLAALNLLPLPALDGGRILFALPEALFGKRIPQKYENIVNGVGFLLLILIVIYINLQDFINPVVIP